MTSGQPLESIDYELTDEFALQAARFLFEVQTGGVKVDVVRQGMPHAALPLILAIVMLAIAQAVSLIWAWESLITKALLVASVFVQLWLMFKLALYFWRPFSELYIRRAARQMVRGLRSRAIRWTLFEDRLETKSAISNRKLAWRDLQAAAVFPDFWCLHWPGLQLIVPAAVLSAVVQSIIRRKADEAGASIGGQ